MQGEMTDTELELAEHVVHQLIDVMNAASLPPHLMSVVVGGLAAGVAVALGGKYAGEQCVLANVVQQLVGADGCGLTYADAVRTVNIVCGVVPENN